ncbi:hypothetical protein CGMCC3_g6284 [Colletotrichum fructicola]|nr:uncharacterized protein CGMCC3_g6284 [Colletotrichum fructicola]KAE9577712.1 hypothetical protein CGMCC3_g6284 [Colletotrichum fructicola]
MGVGMLRETLDPYRREGGMGVPSTTNVTSDTLRLRRDSAP